jgi:uncharacterized protein (DUF433 family)
MNFVTAICELQFSPTEAAFIADLPQRDVQKAFDEEWFDTAPRRDIQGVMRRCLGPAELVHLRLVKDVARYAVLQTEAKKLIHRQLRERMPDVLLASGDHVIVVEAKRWDRRRLGEPSSAADALLPLIEHKISSSRDLNTKEHLEQWLTEQPNVQRVFFLSVDKDAWGQLRAYFDHMIERLKDPVQVAPISVDAAPVWEGLTERLAEATAAQLAVVSDPDIRGGEPIVRGTRIPVHLLQDLVAQGATHQELLSDYPSLDERRLESALLYARIHPRPGRPKKRPWQTLSA